MLNPQAQELNQTIQSVNPVIGNLLSKKGKAIFFPKEGILSQGADARNCSINATIGTALEDDSDIMYLGSIAKNINIPAKEAFTYAKGPGVPELRKIWKEKMIEKNPSLSSFPISLPLTTHALTHGLSMVGFLFVDPGDRILVADPYWGNYRLIFEHTWGATLGTYPIFNKSNGFNCDGLMNNVLQGPPGKKILILNFPNNPTGYTPLEQEAKTIVETLIKSAEAGNQIVVILDDAYFGLVYESGPIRQSLFAYLANAHENILAIKLDGATKEDFVWGFRVGFVTFGSKSNSQKMYEALENKLAGAVRGTISNASHIGQSLLLKGFTSNTYQTEKLEKFETLKKRYSLVRKTLDSHPEYKNVFKALPFNSGYFMCIRLEYGNHAEQVRQILLKKYDTGIIAMGDIIRIAFSSTPTNSIETLFHNIYTAAKEVIG